jgi:hypothetical protein
MLDCRRFAIDRVGVLSPKIAKVPPGRFRVGNRLHPGCPLVIFGLMARFGIEMRLPRLKAEKVFLTRSCLQALSHPGSPC